MKPLSLILIIFSALSLRVALVRGDSCRWGSPAGSCAGPVERTLTYRARFLTARSCSANQVSFFLDNSGRTACGECIPGHHGNWRVHGNELHTLPGNIQQCVDTDSPSGLQCSLLNIPHPTFSPSYACELNQFCNDTGACQSMLQSPLYLAPCGSGSQCGPGLNCIGGRCLICTASTPNFRLRDEHDRLKHVVTSVDCVDNQYVLTIPRTVNRFSGLRVEFTRTSILQLPRSMLTLTAVGILLLYLIVSTAVVWQAMCCRKPQSKRESH